MRDVRIKIRDSRYRMHDSGGEERMKLGTGRVAEEKSVAGRDGRLDHPSSVQCLAR